MNSQRGRKRHQWRQGGIALLTVLFALLLISGIAFGMMYMANTETMINSNFRDLQKAQYGAWSGIHEARGRLISISSNPITKPTTLPLVATNTGILYILNPGSGEIVDPSGATLNSVYPDTELCHEGFPGLAGGLTDTGNNVPCATYPAATSFATANSKDPGTGTAYALPYKWVRVTIKNNVAAGGDTSTNYPVTGSTSSSATTPICWNGFREILLPSGTSCESYVPANPNDPYLTTVYMITSLGVTLTGARRMVQMESAFNPPFSSNAAVASNDNVVLNGALTVNGYDNCSCSCKCTDSKKGTTYDLPSSGACNTGDTITSCVGKNSLTCTSKWGIYAQGSVQNPTGANENIYSESSPAYSGGNTDFPYNPSALVQAYSSMAGVVNVTGTPYNWSCDSSGCGTHSGPTFGTYPTTDPSSTSFNANNPQGAVFQITYIPGGANGSTHLSGNATGAGVLLVQGDLDIDGGLNFYGLIVVTGSVKFAGGGSNPTNIYGAIISGQPVIDTTTVGGSANIHYDACALANQFKGQPPTVLASRELPY